MKVSPSVSVLVTTYRHANYVREALESLRHQTSQDFETIITDDASPDGTAEVIQAWLDETGFSAKFIRNSRNRGICANRNTAIKHASGKYICSLSGDDRYLPHRIAQQVSQFEALEDDVAALYGDARLIDKNGDELAPSFIDHYVGGGAPPQDIFRQIICFGNFLPAPAVMIRRSALIAVGLYDEDLFYEDEDMWLRLAYQFGFVHAPGAVIEYRVLSDSMSNSPANRPAMRASEFQICSKWRAIRSDLRNEINERMWRLAKYQILQRYDAQAIISMAEIAQTSPHRRRRIMARSVTLTRSGMLFRIALPIYHEIRRLMSLIGPKK